MKIRFTWYKIFRYGKLKKLKRGITITIMITHKCNLHCNYCSLKIPNGEMLLLKYKDMTFQKLMDIINDFPLKIREVTISGGEPALNKDFPKMINWILNKGIFVTIYSNLTRIDPYFLIQQNYKLRIQSTYHVNYNRDKFIENYYKIKKYHRIDVDEIGTKTLSFSRLKRFCSTEDIKIKIKNYLRVGIDGLIFTNCYDLFDYYTKIEQ